MMHTTRDEGLFKHCAITPRIFAGILNLWLTAALHLMVPNEVHMGVMQTCKKKKPSQPTVSSAEFFKKKRNTRMSTSMTSSKPLKSFEL